MGGRSSHQISCGKKIILENAFLGVELLRVSMALDDGTLQRGGKELWRKVSVIGKGRHCLFGVITCQLPYD
jgi:hypothetical protein